MEGSTVVARFYGITIRMYPLNHHPSHFHAEYAGSAAVYAITSCEVLAGGSEFGSLGIYGRRRIVQ